MVERRNFDTVADTWDEEPRRIKLAVDVAGAIMTAVPLTKSMIALDYGCGTGLLTLCLQPEVRRIIGADSSPQMLKVLETKVRSLALSNVTTMLLDAEAGGTTSERFDLLTCHMTMHHVENIPVLFDFFNGLLHSGGTVCLSDLDVEDGSFHSDLSGVFFWGFDRDRLRGDLAQAGFEEIRNTTASVINKKTNQGEREYPVFLITARKK